MEIIYFGTMAQVHPWLRPWWFGNCTVTVLVLDNDYCAFPSSLTTQNFSISTWRILCQSR